MAVAEGGGIGGREVGYMDESVAVHRARLEDSDAVVAGAAWNYLFDEASGDCAAGSTTHPEIVNRGRVCAEIVLSSETRESLAGALVLRRVNRSMRVDRFGVPLPIQVIPDSIRAFIHP